MSDVRPIPQEKIPALGGTFAVTASNPTIAGAGYAVLAAGGNAVDASLAMAATGWMVLPGQCGVGGDLFAIVREPDGRVWTVNGSGEGPAGADVAAYRDAGMTRLPLTGPFAVTVPGAMGAVRVLAGHATRSLADLWAPAIHIARTGFVCTAKTRADLSEHEQDLLADPDAASIFLPRGGLPRVGERLVQPELADTLAALADDPGSFYTGGFADRAVSYLRGAGVPFDGQEWARGAAISAEDAISIEYGGVRVHQTPLPTPGWQVLQQAGILDGRLSGLPQLGAEALTWLAGAARASFADRFEIGGSDDDAWRHLLEPDRLEQRARAIAENRLPAFTAGAGGHTTSTVCVDAEGRAVSMIHSLAFTFGARVTVPGTGVLLNNRLGRGAYLLDGHPNALQPGRRPMHTLNAWVVDSPRDGLLHVGNTPGGDGQVQWNMQLLSHLLDHGDSPQRAVALPRFQVHPGSDADVIHVEPTVRVEQGIPAEALEGLRAAGHTVVETPVLTGGPGGSALVISRRADGTVEAGADPRMEGTALAF